MEEDGTCGCGDVRGGMSNGRRRYVNMLVWCVWREYDMAHLKSKYCQPTSIADKPLNAFHCINLCISNVFSVVVLREHTGNPAHE